MSSEPVLPSLDLLLDQVARERETMNNHAESVDANTVLFQCGLGVAVLAAAAALVVGWSGRGPLGPWWFFSTPEWPLI